MEIIIGIISGIISGTGMGGGTILIFLLSQISGIEHHKAQAANLIFFIPTAIVAIIINIKNKNIDLKLAMQISILGIIGAIIGAKVAVFTDVNSLKKYFGFFLLIIAIREIYTLFKNHKKLSIEKS
ncbi:MAG: TSUP family transporter [Clostridia bacterium]|nr:TSUP family transporter [Clostridia bacterium]